MIGLNGPTAVLHVAMVPKQERGHVITQLPCLVVGIVKEIDKRFENAFQGIVQVSSIKNSHRTSAWMIEHVFHYLYVPFLLVVVNCVWLPWTNWTECSEECGGGSQHRNRDKLLEKYGGLPCKGDDEEIRDCNTHHCPSKFEHFFFYSLISAYCHA